MRIEIENIKVAERIRKLTAGMDELAKDIQKNGLINPITVMAMDGDDNYQLLAGLRRLRAAQSLGWEQIEATVVAPKDAEAALSIEYSENVQREAFTFSEKMDYALLISEIEAAKAQERKLSGKQIESADLPHERAEGQRKRETRAIVGDKIGMSGFQYDRAKYVATHAPQELVDELDRGERSIYGTYEELRAANNPKPKVIAQAESEPKKSATAKPFEVPKPTPETDLQRAIRAESELDAFKYRQHNEIYHRDSLIESLKKRVAELEVDVAELEADVAGLKADVTGLEADVAGLEAALEAANARIRELEGIHAATL